MSWEQTILTLRTLLGDALDKGVLSTARFYGDKLLTLSNCFVYFLFCVFSVFVYFLFCIFSVLLIFYFVGKKNENYYNDVYLLAKVYYHGREYRRCVNLLQEHGLVPRPNVEGPKDITFIDEMERMNPNGQKKPNRQEELKFLLLATQAYFECGEYESSLLLLGDEDNNDKDLVFRSIQPKLLMDSCEMNDTIDVNLYLYVMITSALCVIRARALEQQGNLQRALHWYKKALLVDAKNTEVNLFLKIYFKNIYIYIYIKARILLQELLFPKDYEWLKLFYESKINEMGCCYEELERIQNEIKKIKPLDKCQDMSIILANSYYILNGYHESYNITKNILINDPFILECLPSHISCLVELGKQSEMYLLAHDLIENYPEKAISWYAVGCYYCMIRRQDTARKFLLKATKLGMYNILIY
ncbi:hypothetical protein RFI_28660 [Reticulomyxa filosa]|uniref:Uncharacterized protein n=1 Tax=Reticulomyxa filosa TaxID=46433 RepID=X6M5H8_RETFI|nr:hypothetical protein RFI_28660 [Reticulomyxa filosa]|eukprot:ETO08727.1 hypothetical protein RFI_28660 [Reticulomyxa filosa]